ncbi:oxidoreductase [Aureococcus anophagefferens]|nr:oxidoreductase [Aureococcus anophagefferens]
MARSRARAQPAGTRPQRVATRTLVLFALLARAESLAPADALSRRALGTTAAGALTTTAGVAAAKPAPPEVATDKRGKPLSTDDFLSGRPDGPAELVAGLGGEPTILLVEDGKLADYAIQAECTHLGCLVGPYNPLSQRFVCPCHGSGTPNGAVARPAPSSLKLAKVGTDDQGRITLERWTAPDFRDG